MTKKSILISLFLLLCSISSLAFAHTVIRDVVQAGQTSYNAMVITHACGFGDTGPLGVIAQSAVFPSGPNALVTDASGNPVDLASVLIGGQFASSVISVGAIQDHDVFYINHEIAVNDVVRAIHYKFGYLGVHLTGVIPFRLSGVTFKEASCVNMVKVRVAIANWCSHDATSNARADVWMGKLTSVFNDGDIVTASAGFWPAITIKRNLEENPLGAGCGEGQTIIIEPSNAAINQYLPMVGFVASGETQGGGGEH